MGIAFATTLEDDETFTTLDLTCKFFKPIWNAHLTATAYLVKLSAPSASSGATRWRWSDRSSTAAKAPGTSPPIRDSPSPT